MSKKLSNQLRNKDVLSKSANGGQYTFAKSPESGTVLEAPRRIENITPSMEKMGLVDEQELAKYVLDRHKRTVQAQMNRVNTAAKNNMVNFKDLMNEATWGVIQSARDGNLQNAENLTGYITNICRNVVNNKSAVSKNVVDTRAKKALDEMLERFEELHNEAPDKEIREDFTRKIRESFADTKGGHKPSLNYHLPPTITYSIENTVEYGDMDVSGTDLATSALINNNTLYTHGSIASSLQPEMRAMDSWGELHRTLDEDMRAQEEHELAIQEITEAVNASKGQMTGVVKRRALAVLAERFNLPSQENVEIPQGKATKFRKIIATPSDVMDVCMAWQHGELDEKGEAFFAPWGDTDEEDKDRLVKFFTTGVSDPKNALQFWEESLRFANTMQKKRDRGYIAAAKAKFKKPTDNLVDLIGAGEK